MAVREARVRNSAAEVILRRGVEVSVRPSACFGRARATVHLVIGEVGQLLQPCRDSVWPVACAALAQTRGGKQVGRPSIWPDRWTVRGKDTIAHSLPAGL